MRAFAERKQCCLRSADSARILKVTITINNTHYVDYVLGHSPKWWKTVTRGGGALLKKKFFRNFVKWRLNPWCHIDYFTDVLATFLYVTLVVVISVLAMAGQRALRKVQKVTFLVLASKFIRSLSDWTSMGCAGPADKIHGGFTS